MRGFNRRQPTDRRGAHILCAPSDVTTDDVNAGVVIDGGTVAAMIAVWGAAYVPTLLHSNRSETSNTLPISVVAEQMQRYGLPVDVDIISQGRRTVRDNYADQYRTLLAGRPAAGQRTATLLVRLNTRAADTVSGLSWRRDTVAATLAATRRIVRALNQYGCRAHVLTAAQMREAVSASLGGREGLIGTYRDEWTRLNTGKGYVTSYFFSRDDITPSTLSDVWSYPADHITLTVALRRHRGGVQASASVRLRSVQPYADPPALLLNAFTGRQWDALACTLPGRRRLHLPAAPVLAEELDQAVAIGPSGVLLGKFGDAMLLMPLSDPASPTRIAVRVEDDRAVRQLIRRAAAVGEQVAVYDTEGRWTMTSGTAHIWSSRDPLAQPSRPPTMVFHNGGANPYPGARTSVTVGPADVGNPDIMIEQSGTRMKLKTRRFATTLDAVSFRNEEAYLR